MLYFFHDSYIPSRVESVKTLIYLNSSNEGFHIFLLLRQSITQLSDIHFQNFDFMLHCIFKKKYIHNAIVTKKKMEINFFRHSLIGFHTNLDLYH